AAEIALLVKLLAIRTADWVREGDLADARDNAWEHAETEDAVVDEVPAGFEYPAHLQSGPELERRRRVIGSLACCVLVIVGAVWATGGASAGATSLPFWSHWNYSGYESKPAWPEFQSLINTMNSLPPGRALWEPSSDIDKYGTTLALELLPYFTKGRIDSM